MTLEEIRQRGQKPRYREDGNWLARRWARPAAVYGTWIALRLGIPADWVTAAAALAWLFEAVVLALGTPVAFLASVGLGYLGFWLDHVDGQVARVRGTNRIDGIFLDFWIHTAHTCVRGFGLGWGLFAATQRPIAILAGMAASFGWVMISHSNDAAYKAMFARLKTLREQERPLRLRSVSAQDAQADRPKSLKKRTTWILAKLQEPHCVLITMTFLALLYAFDRDAGIVAWCWALGFWAFTAPVVAIGRLVRKVRSDSVSAEFSEWFEVRADDGSGDRARTAE